LGLQQGDAAKMCQLTFGSCQCSKQLSMQQAAMRQLNMLEKAVAGAAAG
jgi:hypothetical protein